jgi:hypothetical protein
VLVVFMPAHLRAGAERVSDSLLSFLCAQREDERAGYIDTSGLASANACSSVIE